MIGTTLGRYKIVELAGKGGMAEVYKAYHPDLDRYVAIKVMHPFLTSDESFAERFRHEAKSIAHLRHPNIVQLYDFATDGETTYMVMEFIPGPSLKNRLAALEQKGRWLSLEEAARIIRQVGEALDYAHQRGMIHRDVKPANIMFGEDDTAILTDFGIVKMLTGSGSSGLTASGALIGTPAYMSPEQCMGAPGDERTDIYALGIVLYQLVTGKLPFDADTPMGIVFKHVNDPLLIPSELNPDLPEGIERVILKALAKKPEDRYRSVREMLDHLDRAMKGETVPPVDPAITTASLAVTEVAPPTRRRPAWRLALAGGALAAVLALIGFLVINGSRERTPTLEPTATAVAAVSATRTPTPTDTPAPTATPTPSATWTPSPTPEPTHTDTPTSSPTPTETSTPTPTGTAAPSPTFTETPLPTFGVGSPATALRNVNVYPTNSSDTAPLALVRQSETVTVLGRYGNWLQVRTKNDVTGWIYQPGWLDVPGDIDVLPTVIPPQVTPPTVTPPPCETGPLTLGLWPIPGTEQCLPGGRWSVEIQYIAGGGNCVYTYYWQEERIHGPTTSSELVYTVEWGNAALTGTGMVESGGETIQHDLYVPKPPQCP